MIATVEFVWYVAYCLPLLSKSVYFKCQVGPLSYDCTGHPGTFYVYLGNYIIIRRKIAQEILFPLFKICWNIMYLIFYILASFSVLIMAVFLACCVLNLTWTVASTKYCEMHRTMNELMKKLRIMAKMGLRKGNDFYIECVEIVSS